MKIATEAIFDPYGGLFTHTRRFKKFSKHQIQEIPSVFMRKMMGRSRWAKKMYRETLLRSGITGFDVVHSRSDPWFINVSERSRSSSCKWVHTYHTLFFEEHYSEGLQDWHRDVNRALLETARKADRRIAVSNWGHEYLKEKYSIDTIVIRNGADLQLCDAADGDRFKAKYGCHDFALFVGSFREVKDPVLYIELAGSMPGMDFLMIGDGIDETTLTRKYNVEIPRNLKLLGRIEHMDVLDATKACSVYVMTSRSEGLPNGLLEAMALARPVVVPRHTGCLELVCDERYGFLYDNGSIDDLVDKTRKALSADNMVGESARKRIVENFDWKESAKELDRLYDSLK